MLERFLVIKDRDACAKFLSETNYYRFSGYARYFQKAPHLGDNDFLRGATFDEIRAVYEADQKLRIMLTRPLAEVELLLRSHVAYVIAHEYQAYITYLEEDFYTDIENKEPTVASCIRDIERSKDRHILRYTSFSEYAPDYSSLPVWSAVEAWSFGTLSKVIERGGNGTIAHSVASSLGVAKAGFEYRIKALVYLRNRCAHQGRLWNHSVIDSGPTPNNVRVKAKKLAGQFEPRSILDLIASLDDILLRSRVADPLLPALLSEFGHNEQFWKGLCRPVNPKDHVKNSLSGHKS